MSEQSDYVYDVFISYSPADSAWVDGYLLDVLVQAGLRCHTAAAFELGAPVIAELERAIRQSRRTLLVLSSAYQADNLSRFTELLGQSFGTETATWPVLPIIFQRVDLPPRLAMLVGLDATDPANWPVVIGRLLADLQRSAPAAPPLPPCPYPGMMPFRESDTSHFYGRETEVAEMVERLRLSPALAIIGPSGSGKSSLVFAGLIPALRASRRLGQGEWDVRSMRPGAMPLATLQAAVGDAIDLETFQRLGATSSRVLLVVDQFEEVFAQRSAQADAFQSTLARLADVPGCYLILTVRADFFADLLTCPLWSRIKDHRYEVLPLDATGLRQAIVRPAEDVGVYVEAALVERLVADAAGEPGVLPFVQETLTLLWEHLERRFLPLRAYEALVLPSNVYSTTPRTGLQVAMARRADVTLASLPDVQQAIARRIFLRLVQFGEGRADTRRQQPVEALRGFGDDQTVFEATLQHLVASRLLTLSSGDGDARKVDLAHEALIAGWPALTQWVTEQRDAELIRRRLEEKATEWVRLGRGESGLFDRFQMQEVETWLQMENSTAAVSTADLTALIIESRRVRKREARRRTFRQVFTYGVLGVVVVVLIGIAMSTVAQWSLNRRWEAVVGAPGDERTSALAGNAHGLVLGSYDRGVAWMKPDGKWTGWQRTGLPLVNPADKLNDPTANVQQIYAIALDDRRPDERYVFSDGRGVFRQAGAATEWSEISAGLSRFSDACSQYGSCQPLAVDGGIVAYIADEPGFYLSKDGGATWTLQTPSVAAAPGTLYAAAFDAQGRLLLGDGNGLIRSRGAWDARDPKLMWDRIFGDGKVVQITPHGAGGVLLVIEDSAGSQQFLCLGANDLPTAAAWSVPAAVRLLTWLRFYKLKVTGVAADLARNNRYYVATTHGAVYATDCAAPPTLIGRRPWLAQGVGRLATTADAQRHTVLYWASERRFEQLMTAN